MDSIKMVSMILHAGQRTRHRHKKETFGLSGRSGWDDLREQHWNIYITVCKTENQREFDIRCRAPKSGGMRWGGRSYKKRYLSAVSIHVTPKTKAWHIKRVSVSMHWVCKGTEINLRGLRLDMQCCAPPRGGLPALCLAQLACPEVSALFPTSLNMLHNPNGFRVAPMAFCVYTPQFKQEVFAFVLQMRPPTGELFSLRVH